MGIATVAVYSDADRDALHVELADEVGLIGPAPSRESTSSMDKIIAACKADRRRGGAPGYGFLSENEDFARRVEEEGIVFIGPKHAAIAAMGDKIAVEEARRRGQGQHDPRPQRCDRDAPITRSRSPQDIGYPVMIKAVGRRRRQGIARRLQRRRGRARASASCRNEARASFGDDRVFIEKFVEEPRHIEIQVLGDAHGNCVYLWRARVLDPAPPPEGDRGGAERRSSSDATRKAMGEQAVALAKAVELPVARARSSSSSARTRASTSSR